MKNDEKPKIQTHVIYFLYEEGQQYSVKINQNEHYRKQ